ncbi:MAG: ATPase [Coriobacteriia bacterium]|nr:ATPase [Coriobacteriia bacterium]
MQYFLGIDSGGSKAAYVLIDEEGATLSLHLDVGYNRTADPTDVTVGQISAGIQKCLASSPGPINLAQISGACIGLSYYGELSDKDAEITAALKEVLGEVGCYFTNDCEVAWAGSLVGKPGVNIVAGTGAMAYGQNESGTAARAGGWNHFFSDEGSCYWLGRRAMELFSKEADGREPRGPLYDIVYQAFALGNDYEFIVRMEQDYIGSRRKVAELQLLLEAAAAQGDLAAVALYEEATDELFTDIATVAATLGLLEGGFPVSYSGGLFRSGSQDARAVAAKEKYVVASLRKKVGALGATLQEPLLEPWQGAALCAIREFCPEALNSATANLLQNT